MAPPALPELGAGLMFLPGLRPVVELAMLDAPDALGFVEVEPQTISVHVAGALRPRPRPDEFLASVDRPVVVHSVGAPVAGSVHDERMLAPAADYARALDAPWASEHLNFNRAPSGDFLGFLLPQVQSTAAVGAAARNIARTRELLGVPLAVETPVNYLRPYPGEMSDGQFLAAVAGQADCGLLVDLHNLLCNERNGRQAVLDVLDELPLDRVWEVHVAGGGELDGYWVDAHSGLVDDALWRLAEVVVPRLPNLKALTFEMMPQDYTSGAVPAAAVLEQLRRLDRLWASRGSRDPEALAPPERTGTLGRARAAVAALPAEEEWEQALADALAGRPARSALDARMLADPGIALYRKMIRAARVSSVVDVLRLTYRFLALGLGEDAARRRLDGYAAAVPATPAAHDEARRFAAWLRADRPPLPHLDEVVAFELAAVDVQTQGREQVVPFTREPLGLLSALGAGRLPGPAPAGDYELVLTP
jgi:uncharacterized protein (UPF0276 family)